MREKNSPNKSCIWAMHVYYLWKRRGAMYATWLHMSYSRYKADMCRDSLTSIYKYLYTTFPTPEAQLPSFGPTTPPPPPGFLRYSIPLQILPRLSLRIRTKNPAALAFLGNSKSFGLRTPEDRSLNGGTIKARQVKPKLLFMIQRKEAKHF